MSIEERHSRKQIFIITDSVVQLDSGNAASRGIIHDEN
ncbi:hypothetical protein Golax_001153 [Gossypium laxum]|uniref:Uncharacterized protein n=1 Tax=Gossypium laxum TaxID=34288 RepID=A0A7J9AW57_9ROSI|nr:hypothetical protein [Gossypium laxum]